MEIILLWLILIALVISLIILVMALSNAYEDTKMEQLWKPKTMKLSDDKLLLSRWELNRKLAQMRKEQRKLGW